MDDLSSTSGDTARPHQHHGGEPQGPAPGEYGRFTHQMNTSMERMMADMHRDPPSGNADIDFLVMMIPHHSGAVAMARLVLAAGSDPLTRAFAEQMIADQSGEIAGMRGRLAALQGTVSSREAA